MTEIQAANSSILIQNTKTTTIFAVYNVKIREIQKNGKKIYRSNGLVGWSPLIFQKSIDFEKA